FSGDGRTMLAWSVVGPLIEWDLAGKRIARTVSVGDLRISRAALHPDGRQMIVVGTPKFNAQGAGGDPQDLPQPRVLLIDLADPRSEPEVLVLPNGAVAAAALSPDGNTLAAAGLGGVHVIDVSARRKK